MTNSVDNLHSAVPLHTTHLHDTFAHITRHHTTQRHCTALQQRQRHVMLYCHVWFNRFHYHHSTPHHTPSLYTTQRHRPNLQQRQRRVRDKDRPRQPPGAKAGQGGPGERLQAAIRAQRAAAAEKTGEGWCGDCGVIDL
jgi:hypothetical protein